MIFIPMVSIMKQVCHKMPVYSSSVELSDRHRTSQRLSDNFNYYFACDDDGDDDACFVDDAGCHGATDGWQCHRPLYFIELAGLALALSLLAPPAFQPGAARAFKRSHRSIADAFGLKVTLCQGFSFWRKFECERMKIAPLRLEENNIMQ